MQQLSLFPHQPSRLLLRELPSHERPEGRLARYGALALADSELVEVVLGSPEAIGRELLARFGGLPGLAQANLADLEGVPGLGPVRAARIKAALELGRRLFLASPEEPPQVKSPADAANLLMLEMGFLEQEHLRTILLDSRNHVLDITTVYIGSLNTNVVRVCEVFREAIKRNCAALIVVHNHPSGDPTPSPEDIQATELIVQAGQLLGIEVLDHVIIGRQRYVSLKERGLGFPLSDIRREHQ